MTRLYNLLLTTAMLAGVCLSGIEPASAQKSPSISSPHISPMRPDFNMRAPNTLRDRDVSDPDEARAPKKKASRPGKKTKSAHRQGGTAGASGISVVSDRVLKTGSSISGGWREYAADRSWRRVVFTLEDHTATIVFSDGMPGRRLPSVTHFVRSGPGPKGSPATYHQVSIFAGASPSNRDKAIRPSPIPSDVATRIRGLGVDFKLLKQLMDDKRGFAEVGSAFDAARGAHDAGGFFPDRPRGSPGEGNWSAPWRGVGGDGRASDEPVTTDDAGNTVVHHADGSTTTVITWDDPDGSVGVSRTNKDKAGNITGGGGSFTSADGDTYRGAYTVNPRTGETTFRGQWRGPDGNITWVHGSHNGTQPHTTPSETGGRSFFDEAWMAKALPWFMDAYYEQWKREIDLVRSGGRISQPGGQPTLIFNESPEVGADAVVNCGASDSNPCAGPAGVAVDPRGGFRSISQPGRGVGPDVPAETGPRPPIPEPAPQ